MALSSEEKDEVVYVEVRYKYAGQDITAYVIFDEEMCQYMGGRITKSADGRQCVIPCGDGMKLDEEGVNCVYDCESGKYQVDEKTALAQCVRDCEHWWYKEQSDGLCKKEAWRKNTAIAVPVVVVVLAVVAVLLVFLLKKRGTKGGDKSAKMEGRDQVSTA